MAILPLFDGGSAEHAWLTTGAPASSTQNSPKGLATMGFLVFIAFLLLLVGASMAGLTADSRDGADWAPTAEGRRVPRRT